LFFLKNVGMSRSLPPDKKSDLISGILVLSGVLVVNPVFITLSTDDAGILSLSNPVAITVTEISSPCFHQLQHQK